ncbi:GbsR/MarR family transcriptional regulator [Diaphorobacter aerolatus]|uniref:Winged helix-turn-helix transcriptional regulator n=1 Tax=Diaphorobacter aerolatus TaxID=1288495 RepID=A0A7H0GLR5_9BURK|nr:MarR family transcriptional regulator [Diaphorobacter aerolatus]QNP49231.1 winged helix-turn-helix transcriptional regulator [Diaphorobacter aerolatus]
MSPNNVTGQLARELFIERNAMQAENSGLSRIAGRLIAVLLLDGGPISFSDLAERVQASRGSVSTNTRLLERLGVIERVAVRGERQDFFQLQANPFAMSLEQSIQECLRFSGYVEELLATCDLTDDAVERLLEAQHFHRVTAEAMQAMLVKLDSEGWRGGVESQGSGSPAKAVKQRASTSSHQAAKLSKAELELKTRKRSV